MHVKRFIVIPLSVVFLYFLPLIIFGEDSCVLIHDNLDSSLIFFKVLAKSGHVFSPSSYLIQNFFNGVPRISFGSEFNFIVLLYSLFSPFVAYVVNLVLMHVVAFFGMHFLLSRHFINRNEEEDGLICAGVSLAFALLPFWPSGGLSVAGLPLALCVFLNIRSRQATWVDWLVLISLPFYSSLVLSFSFFLLGMFGLWCWDLSRGRRDWHFFGAMLLMGAVYLLVEYRLVVGMLFGQGFVSHRLEFVSATYDMQGALWRGWFNFINGQYHAHSLHKYIILPTVVITLFLSIVKKEKDNIFIFLLILIVTISLWYGFWKWEGWFFLKNKISLLRSFNFSRAHFIHPLLWYLVFAMSLCSLRKYFKCSRIIISFIMAFQVGVLFLNSNFINEYRGERISYREFYAQDLFNEIKNYISEPQDAYRVVSLGLHPAIAAYNGFFTVDMYFANYPLDYKHTFRKVIANELEQDAKLRSRFDDWGSRVYLFSHELGYNFLYKKNLNVSVSDLSIDTTVLSEMGCHYLISAVKIENFAENKLEFLRLFSNENSAWDIFLYRVVGR